MDNLDLEIEMLQEQIAKLNDRLNTLKSRKRKAEGSQRDPRLAHLVLYVIENPGCDRSSIEKIFPTLSFRELTNLLTKARRHGSVVNQGSRAHPAWYWKNNEERLGSTMDDEVTEQISKMTGRITERLSAEDFLEKMQNSRPWYVLYSPMADHQIELYVMEDDETVCYIPPNFIETPIEEVRDFFMRYNELAQGGGSLSKALYGGPGNQPES